VVVPQFIYFGELVLSSLLFLGVVYRMKKYARENEGGQSRTPGLINLLCTLILMLIFANLCIGGSLTVLNIFYVIYPTPAEAHAALTLGVWDFLTGVFSISFLSMIILTTLILNIRGVGKMFLKRNKKHGVTIIKSTPELPSLNNSSTLEEATLSHSDTV